MKQQIFKINPVTILGQQMDTLVIIAAMTNVFTQKTIINYKVVKAPAEGQKIPLVQADGTTAKIEAEQGFKDGQAVAAYVAKKIGVKLAA